MVVSRRKHHTDPTMRLTRCLAVILCVLLAAGCSAELAGVGGAGLAGDINQGNVGQTQRDRTQQQVGGLDGQGRGRVAGVTYTCPDDADNLTQLMRTVPSGSLLTDTEKTAAETLYRAAVLCDPDLSSRYLDWKRR